MAARTNTPADFTGARGSNAGDQYHELWALLHILRLLKPKNDDLQGVAVEGIGPDSPPIDDDAPPHRWEGVDCALFYGAATIETADHVELAQLKYSASNPLGKWTIARLCLNTKDEGNNSVIRRLADDYTKAKGRAKATAIVTSHLISNQAVADEVANALKYVVAPEAWIEKDRTKHKLDRDKLRAASGLGIKKFAAFAAALIVDGRGSQSRHSVGLDVIEALANVLGDDVLSEASQLRTQVRDLMLPEGVRTVTDRDRLLTWFGVYGWEGLFPARAAINLPPDAIPRGAADDVVRHFINGEKIVLLHGEGGSGKTTLSQQVLGRLPSGSVQVTFDCFGGGAYMYSEDKRHRAEKAFLQLINDIAVASNCPVFVPRRGSQLSTVETFVSRLALAASTLSQVNPNAFLLIIVDAADNAVTAATNAQPKERPFVWDIAELDPRNLPSNVRLLLSTRTGRKDSLKLSGIVREVTCDAFSRSESATHLRRSFPDASDDAATQFHDLTGGNPRVQAYALSVANNDLDALFSSLLPNGRTLPEVLETLFGEALEKLGQRDVFDQLTAALAVLPAPANIAAVAAVGQTTSPIVRDFGLDLKKGLRISDDAVTIADEDFEKYIGDRSQGEQENAVQRAAEHFWTTHKLAPYSATHVVAFLVRAGRQQEVFAVLDGDPDVVAINDPVSKREVQNARLSQALASCRQSGDLEHELKTVLLGATARHDEGAFYNVIESEIDLSSEFSHSTVYRRILIDRDRTSHQGSALAQSALAAARKGDRTDALQYLKRYESWMTALKNARRNESRENWTVTDNDVAALIETTFRTLGAERAYRELNRWRPLHLRLTVAQIIVPRLIKSGFALELLDGLKKGAFGFRFALAVAVPLQQAGHDVPLVLWKRCFGALRKSSFPRLDHRGSETHRAAMVTWSDTLVTACEIVVFLNLPKKVVQPTVLRLEGSLTKDNRQQISLSSAVRLDAVTRVWLLKQHLAKRDGSAESFLRFVQKVKPKKSDEPRPPRRAKGRNRRDDDASRENSRLKTLHSFYQARLAVILAARSAIAFDATQLSIPSSAYDFDSGYESVAIRHCMATSVASLTFLSDVSPTELHRHAGVLLERRYQPQDALNPDLSVLAALALKEGFHPELVSLIAAASTKVQNSTTRATEKVSTLIDYSRFLLPISPRDASGLFKRALDIAKDIDDEAVDQIAFVSALAPLACPNPGRKDTANAKALATFAAGASLRLYGSDLFDWADVVSGLTVLDPNASLACIARWSDDGTAHLATTIASFIKVALKRGAIGPAAALALAQTGSGLTSGLIKAITAASKDLDAPTRGALFEEIPRILLTEDNQSSRVDLGSEFLELIGDVSLGQFAEILRDTIKFAPRVSTGHVRSEAIAASLTQQAASAPAQIKPYSLARFDPDVTDLSSVIREVRAVDSYASGIAVLKEIGVLVRDRVPYLEAITRIDPEVANASDWGTVIAQLVKQWASPSVSDWAHQKLPTVISENLADFARWLPYRQGQLDTLLQQASLNSQNEIDVLLAGIAHAGSRMDSKVLFALAKRIAPGLTSTQAKDALDWYLSRLEQRIPQDDRSVLAPRDLPASMPISLGRYFFSLFSDVDTRIRWSAAHAVRLLARTNQTETVAEVYSNFDRSLDNAFRAPDAPFYWLSAKLWAGLTAYRIAHEAPAALASSADILLRAATNAALPHVAIQEAAKRAVLELHRTAVVTLSSATLLTLNAVNVPVKTKKPTKQYRPSPSFNRNQVRSSRRFNFDEMDTIRYWYNSLLHIFPDMPQERILEKAEHWIIDQWGAASDERRRTTEARRSRLRDSDYTLTMHSHGSLPTIEDYGTHLEWNAMLCVAGELLSTTAVGAAEDGQGRFEEWLSGFLPTIAPLWLADIRGSTPLEPQFWIPDQKKEPQWLRATAVKDMLEKAGILRADSWIVVGGHTTYQSSSRLEEITVDSAVVGTETADALVRSFQAVTQRWDTYLPTESDEPIDWGQYRLRGWLAHSGADTRFDERDFRRYDVRRQELAPGSEATSLFGLVTGFRAGNIEFSSETAAFFRYQAWGDEAPRKDRDYGTSSASAGWRLLADKHAVSEFMKLTGM